jgi:2,4-dienoyl-CoA reductase-like NADH-dependent reductase (Old Yellow Enzyme family)
LLFDVLAAVRAVIPETMPLMLRLSATEWMEWAGEESWTVDQTIELAKLLPAAGVDLLDVSSGGNNKNQKIEIHKYYQVSIAGKIREALKADGKNMYIGAVGMISEAQMARDIVQDDGEEHSHNGTVEINEEHGQKTQADIVLIARQFLREPEFVLRTAQKLGVEVAWPTQYHRAPWRKDAQI